MNKRLLFSAVLAATISANEAKAQKVELPTPTPLDLKLDGTDTVYLYNVKAQKFLAAGGNWNTMAVFKDTGTPIAIVKNFKADGVTPTGTYTLWDKSGVSGKATWTKVFVDAANAEGGQSYMDYNNQAGEWKTNFVLHVKENKTLEIQADTIAAHQVADLNDLGNTTTGTRLGYKSDEDLCTGNGGTVDIMMRPTLQTTDPNYASYGVEWMAVGDEYKLRLSLANAINAAVDEGADVAGPTAVYNNASASLEDLQNAIDDVEVAVRNKKISDQNPSPTSPVDMAQFYKNLTCQSLDGWNTEGTFDSNGNVGSGGHGTKFQTHDAGTGYVCPDDGATIQNKFIERWVHRDSDPVTNSNVSGAGRLSDSDIWQTLKNVPGGSYVLKGYYYATKQGSTEKQKGAYALIQVGTEVRSVEISNLEGKPTLQNVLITVPEGGADLSVGFQTLNTTCNHVWFQISSLQYLGAGNAGLLYTLNDAIESAKEEAAALVASETVLTDINTAIDNATAVYGKGAAATTEEIENAMKTLTQTVTAGKENAEAYVDLEAAYNEYNSKLATLDESTFNLDIFDDFIGGSDEKWTTTYDDVASLKPYNTAELKEYMDALANAYKKTLVSGVKPGNDVPNDLLADPSFENGGEGWQGLSGITAVNKTYQNAEAYEKAFDLYQELTDFPDGVYTITAKAFQRTGTNANAYPKHVNGTEVINAYIYGNEVEKKVCSVYDGKMTEKSPAGDGDNSGQSADWSPEDDPTAYYANSMCGFKAACDQGLYNISVNVIVKGGKLRFGIKTAEKGSGTWTIWDDFKLHYDGDNYSAVTNEMLPEAKELAASKMSSDSLTVLNAAIAAAEGENVTADVATALAKAVTAARNSVATYVTLKDAIAAADERVAANERSAEAKAAYDNAKAEVVNGYNNGTYKDAEVPAAIKKLDELVQNYLLFDDLAKATATNPVDISYMIKNNDFSDNFNNWKNVTSSPTGTKQGDTDVNEVEYWSKDNFEFNQTLENMPAGRYELKVQGFYRSANNMADYRDSIANNNFNVKVRAYINDQETAIPRWSACPVKYSELGNVGISSVSGLAKFEDGAEGVDSTYVPNDMITAQAFFESEQAGPAYVSEAASYYTPEGGQIVVGVRKTEKISGDWAIFKKFTLYYLGNNTDGIESVAGNGNNTGVVVGTRIFNVNGIETGRLQQGLNIVKTTLSDGTVRVKKILVK